MWSRNTVRESSHIYFFCGRDPFCEVVRRSDNTHEELTGLLELPGCLFLRLKDQLTSPIRLSDHWISAFCSKLRTLYCLFKSHADIWKSSSPIYFSVYGWLWELTSFHFFPVICWFYLRTEISVTLSIGNKLYSPHHILYFSFLLKPLYWCYLATALNLLSSSTALCRLLSQYIIPVSLLNSSPACSQSRSIRVSCTVFHSKWKDREVTPLKRSYSQACKFIGVNFGMSYSFILFNFNADYRIRGISSFKHDYKVRIFGIPGRYSSTMKINSV